MSINLDPNKNVSGLNQNSAVERFVSASKCGYSTTSSIVNLAAPNAPADNAGKKWYSMFTNMISKVYHGVGGFFGKIYNAVKGFFCGKTEENNNNALTDMQKVKKFADDLKTMKPETFAAEFSKLPVDHLNGIKKAIWIEFGSPNGDPDFGGTKVNGYAKADPAEQGKINGVVTNYIIRQEKVGPVVEFQKIVDNGSVSADDVLAKLNALGTKVTIAGTENLMSEHIKGELFMICGNDDKGQGLEWGNNEVKKDPHGKNLKDAINNVLNKI